MQSQPMQVDQHELGSMVKKLRFLEDSNSALISIQNKLDQLSRFQSEKLLSYDVHYILKTWLVRLRELVKIDVCSVFLVEEGGIEFIRKISEPEELSPVIQKEVEAQINLGNFGQAISNGVPLNARAEVFGKESGRRLSIMIAPLSNLERTIGAVVIVFEEDKEFIRQQTLKLLNILVDFFSLSLENAYLFDDLKSAYFYTIKAITNSIEARDPYTRGHSERVGQYAKTIAEELDWEKSEIELIDWGGMLHDVGKIGIPDFILNKPGKLTDDEYHQIQSHPVIGAQIVKGISFLESAIPYILDHHERFDGKGYSNGVGGEDISVKGRLLAVADSFDAMTSDRPYRKALKLEDAFNEIVNNRGTQFDPQMVEAFEQAFNSGKIKIPESSSILEGL
ncbi:MAG: HD domain-containing protein [Deltaproteobacteria bacterium]|nr:HD domain-containing protein [Deltaproteobacteria bacterium]